MARVGKPSPEHDALRVMPASTPSYAVFTPFRHTKQRGFVYNLLRVRGYKFIDEYADVHGFGNHAYGAAGVAVVDPDGDKLNAVTCFLDPHEGVDFLAWKRRRAAA